MRILLALIALLVPTLNAEELTKSARPNIELSEQNDGHRGINKNPSNVKARMAYAQIIADLIKSNTILPIADLDGNPFAEFEIELMPDGNLYSEPRLTRSSGILSFDQAVRRAILKSVPFPPDPTSGKVPKLITIVHRPKDARKGGSEDSLTRTEANIRQRPYFDLSNKDKCDIPGIRIYSGSPYEPDGWWEPIKNDNYCFGFDSTKGRIEKSTLPECDIKSYKDINCFAQIYFVERKEYYRGELKNGRENGLGQKYTPYSYYRNSGKDSYKKLEGKFLDGIMQEGKIFFHDGSVFVGKFEREYSTLKKTGRSYRGTRTYADGKKYIGETDEGIPNGLGVSISSTGKKTPGRFENGEYVTTEKCDGFSLGVDENNSNGKMIKTCTTFSKSCNFDETFFYGESVPTRCGIFYSTVWIKNKHSGTVKDIEIQCNQIANSGTVLSESYNTVYDLFESEKISRIQIKENSRPQAASIDCFVKSFKK